MKDFAIPQREVRVRVLLQDRRELTGVVFVPVVGRYGEPGHLFDRLNQETEDFLALKVGDDTHLIDETRILTVTILEGGVEEEIEKQVEDSVRRRHLTIEIHLTSGFSLTADLSYVQPVDHERLRDYLNIRKRFIPVRVQDRLVYVSRRQIISVVGLREE